jgi:YD repeat-containing protein
VTSKIKEQNGTITTKNEYTYDDNFMKLTENINNGTDVYTKEFVYPNKNSTSILKSMYDRYMIGVPVETRLLLNGSILIAGKKIEYVDTLDMILPKEEDILEAAIFKPRLVYSYYNKYGKPMSIDNDGSSTVYLWSYNGMYPIAEIKNTTYQQVAQKLSENFISTLADKACPSLSDISTINTLRNSLNGTLVTTFIYNPLVGVTSVTDSRGFTTNYDYDSSGRLIDSYYTKNANKCVINKYQYHYSNK